MSLRSVQRTSVLDSLQWGLTENDSDKLNNSSSRNSSTSADPMTPIAYSANAAPQHTSSSISSAWRVLILDASAREMVAPLIKVKELREQAGVTLHLQLEKPRQAVSGAPAIYLCMPTEENVDQIAQDITDGLFSEFRIQFLASAPRTVLERFAKNLQDVSSIHNVFVADRALSYISLHSDLFTIPHCDKICYAFNSKHLQEKDLELHIRGLAQSLSHVAASISPAAPFVAYCRSSSGTAAEAVAQKFHSTLNDLVKERTYFSPTAPAKTVFLIVDRMADIATALHHHFSYHSLLSDALEMKLNKIVVSTADAQSAAAAGGSNSSSISGQNSSSNSSSSNTSTKQLEVDPETDMFWNENNDRDFRTVHEYVEAALASYQKEYNALMASEGNNNNQSSSSSGDQSSSGGGNQPGGDLARLMQQAPKLAERKRSVDTHIVLAYQCLQSVKSRHLDEFHGVEQALLHPNAMDLDIPTLEKLLEATTTGNSKEAISDRERLLLMLYLAGSGEADRKDLLAYVERYVAAAENNNTQQSLTSGSSESSSSSSPANKKVPPFPALAFLKKFRSMSMRGGFGGSGSGGGDSSSHNRSASKGWGFATELFSRLTGGSETASPVAKVAESIHQLISSSSSSGSGSGSSSSSSGSRTTSNNKEIIFMDPRQRDSSDVGDHPVRASGCNHLVVFVVGGVTPIEYEDLKKWALQKNIRWNITVGGTEVLTGTSMLSQMHDLGCE